MRKRRKKKSKISLKKNLKDRLIKPSPVLKSLKIDTQFFRFLIVGGVNTSFGYAVYTLFLFLGVQYQLASLGALICGIVFSFNTQKKFVFKSTKEGAFVRFVFCWIVIYLFNISLIAKCISYGFDAYLSGAIAIVPVTLFSYFLQKIVVFKSKNESIKTMASVASASRNFFYKVVKK
jgi:putative flippase GtrA